MKFMKFFLGITMWVIAVLFLYFGIWKISIGGFSRCVQMIVTAIAEKTTLDSGEFSFNILKVVSGTISWSLALLSFMLGRFFFGYKEK